MYDIPKYYLVANPINRYSIGDRTEGIRYADNGTLTVTVGTTEPSDDGSYQFPAITVLSGR